MKNEFFIKLKTFALSKWYPLLILAIAMASHLTGFDVLGYAFIVAIATFILVTVDDSRPFFAPLLLGSISTSRIHAFGSREVSALYSSPIVIGILIGLGCVLIAGTIAHVIIFKKYKGACARLKKSPLFLGIILLCIAILIGGIFSEYLDFSSYIISGLFVLPLLFVFLFFKITLTEKQGTIEYLLYIIMLLGIAIALVVAELYVSTYRGQELDSAFKGTLLLGAFVSNSAGEMMVITLPAFFYFGHIKKNGWPYIVGATAIMFFVVLTLSRNAVLFGVPIFLFGLIWSCFAGNNKKFSRIYTITGAIIAISLIVAVLCIENFDISLKFFSDTGFNDRGRFNLWKKMVEAFKEYPIFGAGFTVLFQKYNCSSSTNIFSMLCHDTLFQFLGSTGIIGCITYAFHRFTTIKVFAKKFNYKRLFLGFTILAYLLLSLLDIIFFFPHFIILYALLLANADFDYTSEEN